ncbi:Dehydrodolichyl diphosphate synthase complex subunit nus1 [Halotydeus destructor]|nr:Dehydrodolichyl diphosphate synthase complex subunit nus1 [Halotydeus destructor]
MELRRGFYALTLWLMHFCYSFYERVTDAIRTRLFPNEAMNMTDLQNTVHNLDKMPQHIAFLVDPSDLQYNNKLVNRLAMLTVWCMKLSIKNITLYDQSGRLAQTKHIFEKKVLQFGNTIGKDDEPVSVKNGFVKPYFDLSNGNKMSSTIRFMSSIDGKQNAVEIIRSELGSINSELTPESLDQLFKKNLDLLDPELVVMIGSTPCLFGFLPWEIRLSEIVPLAQRKRHKCTGSESLQDVLQVIAKYNRCNQRFGK